MVFNNINNYNNICAYCSLNILKVNRDDISNNDDIKKKAIHISMSFLVIIVSQS